MSPFSIGVFGVFSLIALAGAFGLVTSFTNGAPPARKTLFLLLIMVGLLVSIDTLVNSRLFVGGWMLLTGAVLMLIRCPKCGHPVILSALQSKTNKGPVPCIKCGYELNRSKDETDQTTPQP
jgi:predicted RNA-binding Zn-ribbon protein involved in translation (DUF1610 family)